MRFAAPFTALALALCAPFGCAHGPTPQQEMEGWDRRYPAAAQELGEWVRTHPKAAPRFFDWDGHHPGAAKEFVTWAIVHPQQNVDRFVGEHLGWEGFDRMVESHRPAAEAFMLWARRNPDAAEDLVSRPAGLEWAGHHLYRQYWEMER